MKDHGVRGSCCDRECKDSETVYRAHLLLFLLNSQWFPSTLSERQKSFAVVLNASALKVTYFIIN